MLVEDDGVGFRTAVLKGRPGQHVGLSIMQERACRLGGVLRIESEPGEGTTVVVQLPIQQMTSSVTVRDGTTPTMKT